MGTLFSESVQLYNLPFTFLLGVLFLYWLMVIAGFLGIETLDFDIGDFGEFLHIGSVPFSIWLSLFAIQIWFYSIMANFALSQAQLDFHPLLRLLGAIVILVPFSAIVTRILVSPLRKMFADKEDDFVNPVGKLCRVTSSEVNTEFGSAEVETQGSPILINIRAKPDDALQKGDEALIIEYDKDAHCYFVSRI